MTVIFGQKRSRITLSVQLKRIHPKKKFLGPKENIFIYVAQGKLLSC